MTCVAILSILVTSLFFGFYNPNTAVAEENGSNNRTYRASVFNFASYYMKDEQDRLSGYSIEFLNLVSKHSRLSFEYKWLESGWDWDDISAALEKGDYDVVTSVSWDDERAEKFAYSLPIGRKNTVISIRENDASYDSGDYSDYDGMRIGLLGNNKRAELDEFIRRKGFAPLAASRKLRSCRRPRYV